MLKGDAECNHAHLSKLLNSKIVYVQDESALKKLEEIKADVLDFLKSDHRYEKAKEALKNAILEEGTKREEEDEKLNVKIEDERKRAEAAEKALHDADQDTSKDYVLSVRANGEYNLVIDSNDGDEAKAIRIKIDGNYGEI